MSYRTIVTAEHRALINSSFKQAIGWQCRVQVPIGVQGISPAITKITSTGNDNLMLPTRDITQDQSNWGWIWFVQVNWPVSPDRDAIMHGVILTFTAAISRNKGEVETRITRQHSYDYISSNGATCSYMNCIVRPIIPTDRLLHPSTPNERDNTMNETFLWKRMSLRKKDSVCQEPLHKWSALTEKTLYNWRTLTMWNFPRIEENM
jgi:hypothetical protein